MSLARRRLALAACLPLLAWGVHRRLAVARAEATPGDAPALSIAGAAAPGEDGVPFDGLDDAPPADGDDGAPVAEGPGDRAEPAAGGALARNASGSRVRGRKRSVFVSRDTVMRLASANAAPSGVTVAAEGKRPPGIRLSGVSALGVGVQDGDVLTDVAGSPVGSRADVVALVLGALGRGAPRITARFYRGQVPWSLVVELPRVDLPTLLRAGG